MEAENERKWVLKADIEWGNISVQNAIYMDEIAHMKKGQMKATRSILTEFLFDENPDNEEPTLEEKLEYLGNKTVNELAEMVNEVMSAMPQLVEKKQKRK